MLEVSRNYQTALEIKGKIKFKSVNNYVQCRAQSLAHPNIAFEFSRLEVTMFTFIFALKTKC